MGTAAVPEWVAPPPREVHDLHWLAWRAAEDTGSARAIGVVQVLAWLAGEQAAPVTERTEQPVPLELAKSEWRAAGAVPLPTLWDSVAHELGVPDWIPRSWHPDWTDAVYQTLRWLLGVRTDEPPMALPVRHEDGTTPTAEELYDLAVQTRPWLFSLPEQRAELRLRTASNAARYRRLAKLIKDTKSHQRRYTLR